MDKRGTNWDIYAARVGADGIVLETNGFAVSVTAGEQGYPTVASAAGAYLVAWQDNRNASSSHDIYGARVDANGSVLDAAGFGISTATQPQRFPHAAGLGTNYMVVWLDFRSAATTLYDIYGARVTTNAAVLEPTGIAICTVSNQQYYPDVATDGTDYFVAWQDLRSGTWDIYGARISAAGTVTDPNGFTISTASNSQQFPTLAWLGTNYMVAWQDTRFNVSYSEIYGARVTSSASVIDTSGIAIDAGSNSQLYPRIATSGSEWMVVYQSLISATNRIVARVISP
jgi:hypothetical protein